MSSSPPPSRTNTRGRRVASTIAAAAATALLVVVPTSRIDASAARITICHQVGNLSYRAITVDVNSIGGGHGHHPGDIIPAFNASQGNRDIHYAGRNLNAVLRAADGLTGADVLAAGCTTPAPAGTAQLAPPTSGVVAIPTPVATLAPDTTVQAGPTPTPQSTAVPVPTSSPPSPTLAPTATPSPTPPTAPEPTLAPSRTVAPDTTVAIDCPDGELTHAGECYVVPPLVVPQTPSLATLTSQPESGSLAPIVECVDDRPDGISTVWFSYESTAGEPVVVERGQANQMSPRGTPPTLFGPGLHVLVVAVETTDGIASWTLAGRTATSSEQSRDCASPLTTADTDTTSTTAPATTDPDIAAPDTTEPGTDGPTPADGCAPGETLADGACTAVEPLRLVVVDNVVECDGHGIARFAAFNDNVFALETDNATTFVSPQRLASEAPEVIDERDVVSDDGSETAALFTVRYVTAVTWSVSHHGLEASISAGVNGADANPDCPDALVASTGADGLLRAPAPLASTGPADDTVPLAVLAALLSALGLGLVTLARRRPSAVH